MMHRVVLAVLVLTCVARAAEIETTASERTAHRAGLIIGLNDPVPAVVGINVGFNVLDFARLTGGIGRFNSTYNYGAYSMETKSVTYGFGTRFLVPGWSLSPIAGISWATIATEGFPNKTNHFYVAAGLEWQTNFGLNLGAGYNQSFDKQVGGLPYFNAGWYFGAL